MIEKLAVEQANRQAERLVTKRLARQRLIDRGFAEDSYILNFWTQE